MPTPFPGIISALSFSTQGGPITISPIIILALAGAFAVIGIILALLFNYHWKAYAVNKLEILQVRFWYFSGMVVFGGGMIVSALLYALSV